MDTDDLYVNEFLDLPEDPEEAFIVLQSREYRRLLEELDKNKRNDWVLERRYLYKLVAFDEVYGLGILSNFYKTPSDDDNFNKYFRFFNKEVELAILKIKIEQARRLKKGEQTIVTLDTTAREAIHKLIDAIRDKLNEITLPDNKRESLFNKLNAFAAEVDRNRTRTEAFLSFAVEISRTAKEVNQELKPLQQIVDRIIDMIEKAQKLTDSLPPWSERKGIESPPKRLPKPNQDLDN